MKVVYLSPSGQLGGAERVLLDILASVKTAEPEWSLHLIASGDGPLVEKAQALGVPTTIALLPAVLSTLGDAGAGGPAGKQISRATLLRKLVRATPAAAKYTRRLRRLLFELKPDVIHTNGFKMHVIGVWAKPRGVPLIWHVHDYVSARPVMARLLKRYAGHCSIAIANSQSVAEDVRSTCQNRFPVQTIYNGIDLDNFSPHGPALDLDALAGLPAAAPGTIKVGMLATLARWKGHETFLRAMALVPSHLPLRGYIAGGALYQTDGSQHSLAELRSLIGELGLSTRVGLTGFVDQPAAAMRALDIIVHASTQPEPFGLVIAEGMACGRAVIASNAGGAAEIIKGETAALAHPPGNATTLAKRITQLVGDNNLRATLGLAGRAIAERQFNRFRLAFELIPIYIQFSATAN